jgi:hypothetical protein
MVKEFNQDIITEIANLPPVQRWLALGHTLFPGQQLCLAPVTQPVDVLLFQGGVGCGKTHAACLLGLELALTQSNSKGMVVAYRWCTLRDAIIPMYKTLLQMLHYREGVDYTMRIGTRSIQFANGSQILFRPLGRSQAYQSLECQWMHAEEMGELTEPLFNRLLTRIRQPGDAPLRFFGTTTPTHGWIKTRFAANNPGGYRKIYGKTAENTVLAHVYEALIQGSQLEAVWPSLLNGEDLPDEPQDTLTQARPKKPAKRAQPASTTPVPVEGQTETLITDHAIWVNASGMPHEYPPSQRSSPPANPPNKAEKLSEEAMKTLRDWRRYVLRAK